MFAIESTQGKNMYINLRNPVCMIDGRESIIRKYVKMKIAKILESMIEPTSD